MWLRDLEADRLRNLKSVKVGLHPGITFVTGRNGHGKTSLLEAVYLLGTGHSFRTRRLGEIVSSQGGPVRVSGEVSGLAASGRLAVTIEDGAKTLRVDGIERDLNAFLGRLDLVALTGESARILKAETESRRRFIDAGIAGIRPSYLGDLADYRRHLAARNALLRRGAAGSAGDTLDIWEERLAASGARIHRQRREYILALGTRLGPAERRLFSDADALCIRYRPSPRSSAEDDPARFASLFRQALAASRRREKTLGFTVEGPHRDDLEISLSGLDLRRFGSAGQHRAAVIALCAGKLGLMRDERRETPLFLMDDFDSDLDDSRTAALVEFIRDGGFQAVLATSKDGLLNDLGQPFHRIRMDGGLARAA